MHSDNIYQRELLKEEKQNEFLNKTQFNSFVYFIGFFNRIYFNILIFIFAINFIVKWWK